MDLIAKRYPNKRPSDYLELDEWTAFQYDSALAQYGDLEDKDFLLDLVDQLMSGMILIVNALGGKVKVKKHTPLINKKIPQNDPSYIPTVKEVLSKLGNSGTVLKK